MSGTSDAIGLGPVSALSLQQVLNCWPGQEGGYAESTL